MQTLRYNFQTAFYSILLFFHLNCLQRVRHEWQHRNRISHLLKLDFPNELLSRYQLRFDNIIFWFQRDDLLEITDRQLRFGDLKVTRCSSDMPNERRMSLHART